MDSSKLITRAYWFFAGCGLVYAIAIGALTIPTVQRNATYAHNVNLARFQNLTNVEQFGFFQHQVQPFTITTPDGIELFGWHILPLHLYREHEQALIKQSDFGMKPYDLASQSVGLQLLANDPHAVAVVSFHGNAAHIGSAHRPSTYQAILSTSTREKPVHVIAFDYRGFGLSTGSPTEEGVILDSVSVLSAITGHLPLPEPVAGETQAATSTTPATPVVDASRIVLFGQSMGTFISSAAYHDWVLRLGRAPFKGLVLLASFSSLSSLMDSYSIKGITPPLLSPLIYWPRVQKYVMDKIVDKWATVDRLVDLARNPNVELDLAVIHARDDWEIPWREGRKSWDQVLDVATNSRIEFARNLDHEVWASEDGKKKLRWQRIRHGGHNRISTSEQAKAAVMRLLEE